MKRTAIALALGTLATTAALAAPGDAWYGTNRDRVIVAPTVTYVEPAPSDRVTVYYDDATRTYSTAPVIVEREYVSRPYGYVVVEPIPQNDLFFVEPRTYSTVEHGLFNRRGPNDFGQ